MISYTSYVLNFSTRIYFQISSFSIVGKSMYTFCQWRCRASGNSIRLICGYKHYVFFGSCQHQLLDFLIVSIHTITTEGFLRFCLFVCLSDASPMVAHLFYLFFSTFFFIQLFFLLFFLQPFFANQILLRSPTLTIW